MEEWKLLVLRAQSGDPDAYSLIVRRFQDMAIGSAFALVGDFHLAEDAAQEAFINAYRDLPKLREAAAFPAWLRKIIFKQCDRFTRGKRLATMPLAASDELAAGGSDPADAAARNEQQAVVRSAIAGLPAREREAVVLFYLGGRNQQEIAAFLGVPVGVVRLIHVDPLIGIFLPTCEGFRMATPTPGENINMLQVEHPVGTVKNRLHQARAHLRERIQPMLNDDLPGAIPTPGANFTTEVMRTLRERGMALFTRYVAAPADGSDSLRQAIDSLSQAFAMGDERPETVWTLYRALHAVAELDRMLLLLQRYAHHAPNAEQEFFARDRIVAHYSQKNQDAAVVAAQRDLLAQMQGKVAPARLLESLSIPDFVHAWRRCALHAEWRAIADALYQRIEDTLTTCQARAIYLRTLIEAVYDPATEYEQITATADTLSALIQKYHEAWIEAEARWMQIDLRGILYSLHLGAGRDDLAAQTAAELQQSLHDYAALIARLQTGEQVAADQLDQLRMYYKFGLHNTGCQFLWTGRYTEAVELFEQALQLQDLAETHFFLAAAILQASGDRQRSLKHFRAAIQSPYFSRRHELKQAFREEYTFAKVHDDPEFNGLLDQEVQKLAQQAGA